MMDNHLYTFSSDVVNIFAMVYDRSGSMVDYRDAIRSANRAFYEDFSRFEEKGSVAILKAMFDQGVHMTPFGPVKDFSTSYDAGGGTWLYDAITQVGQETLDYYKEIESRLNIRPRITFLVFSDGEDNDNNPSEIKEAKDMITKLNGLDATTVFVAFGEAIKAKDGEMLGFSCTRDISSANELISCLGAELSRSCIEQSRSAFSLKSKFFSKAATDGAAETPPEAKKVVADSFFDI